jgi:hypothetical protein
VTFKVTRPDGSEVKADDELTTFRGNVYRFAGCSHPRKVDVYSGQKGGTWPDTDRRGFYPSIFVPELTIAEVPDAPISERETLTRDEFLRVIDAGTALVSEGLNLGERDTDLIDMVVIAIHAKLDQPHVTFDQVISENYDTNPLTWWDFSANIGEGS